MQIIRSIQNRIYEIRGERVMLDFDLADLYEVETKVLNQAVKRNIKRFPPDFMFQLSKQEWNSLRSQIVTLDTQVINNEDTNWSQNVTLKKGRGQHSKFFPYAFTEQGCCYVERNIEQRQSHQHEYCNHAGICRGKY